MIVYALGITSCNKENGNVGRPSEHYSLADFVDSRAFESNASRSNTISPKSNLKAIIRKVANSTNQYRLILKVDSIEVETKDAAGVPQFSMVAMDDFEAISIIAGLSIVDPVEPSKESILFSKGSLQFNKQNDNGFFVYASAPFGGPSGTTDEILQGFDYALVNISYTINAKWISKDALTGSVSISDAHRCFILPNGKAIEQNPTVERINANGRWTHSSGQEYVEKLVITIANDPIQDIEKYIFVPEPIMIKTNDPKEPFKTIELPSIDFDKKLFNSNTGISKFVNNTKISDIYRGYSWSSPETLNNGVFYSVNRKGGKVKSITFSSTTLSPGTYY